MQGKRGSESVWLKVTQDVYQYRNNLKGYIVSYFGEKEVFDLNGEVSLRSIAEEAQFSNILFE